MSFFEISTNAENDLKEIAQYTPKKFGKKNFEQYRKGLIKTIDAIGRKKAFEKTVSKKLPDVFVTKYSYHFIFYLKIKNQKPTIIAVIHEQRDILKRLNNRLR